MFNSCVVYDPSMNFDDQQIGSSVTDSNGGRSSYRSVYIVRKHTDRNSLPNSSAVYERKIQDLNEQMATLRLENLRLKQYHGDEGSERRHAPQKRADVVFNPSWLQCCLRFIYHNFCTFLIVLLAILSFSSFNGSSSGVDKDEMLLLPSEEITCPAVDQLKSYLDLAE
uniref:Uncharacterized protein n=1 Tax=Ditylenchus dipsaci TaxID=166011 RepID=A0A915E223_9BILA